MRLNDQVPEREDGAGIGSTLPPHGVQSREWNPEDRAVGMLS